jgi:NlpC/P60 family putative phage cell wall peptidase
MVQVSNERATHRSDSIVRIARSWLGTPYRHQASCKGAGTDCLGLIRGVWREAIGPEPEPVPPYTPDWSETTGDEDLLAAAQRHLLAIARETAQPGDVVIMRMRAVSVAKHAGILARSADGYDTLIHAYSGHGVVESPLAHAWSRKIAAYYRFPDWSI